MLTLSNVILKKRRRTILGPIDLSLGDSGATMVIGPNGSGKTSLLRAMFGLERVQHGDVTWSNTTAQDHAFVFQSPTVLRRSVADNLAYPLKLLAGETHDNAKAVAHWLDIIGLTDQAQLPATRLSGGERQKLAIARGLIRTPKVLFLDEPCANLDGHTTREIETLLSKAVQSGTRLIMSTHDMGQARRIATDVVFMLNGKIHEFGTKSILSSSTKTPELNAFLKGDIVT